MSKQQRTNSTEGQSPPIVTTPQISDTPVVTGTGSVYWNVRDIVFGPNRSISSADHPEQGGSPQPKRGEQD